jgi:hypothetical protein
MWLIPGKAGEYSMAKAMLIDQSAVPIDTKLELECFIQSFARMGGGCGS